jgi:hypothetical protein
MATPKWVTWVWDGKTLKDGAGKPVELNQERPLGSGTLKFFGGSKGRHVAFFAAPSRYKYSVKLQRSGNYRLGEDYGHRVMDASDEKDPIKKVFRELDTPCSERHLTMVPATDLAQQGELVEEGRREGQYASPGVGLFKRGEHGSIEESWVFEGCDPVLLKGVLLNLLYGADTDEEFLKLLTLRDLAKAQAWLEKHFAIEPVPGHGDRLMWRKKHEGEDVSTLENFLHLRGDHKEQVVITANQVFVALIQRYGFQVLEPFMSEDGQAWVKALKSLDEAVKYVTSRYNVAFVKTFTGFPIRVKKPHETVFTTLGDTSFLDQGEELTPLFHHNGLARRLGKESLTIQQQLCAYDEKIVVSAKLLGSKILLNSGGSISIEKPASDYGVIPLAGLACWGARGPKSGEVITTVDTQIIACLEGEFLFDKVGANLLVKSSYQGTSLKALVWERGRYNVLCLEKGEGGYWIARDPAIQYELFILERRYFRLVYDQEGMAQPGHPLLVVSSPR